MADEGDADDESGKRRTTAPTRPRPGTGGTHRFSEKPTTAVYTPQVATVATPRLVTIPAGRDVAATPRPTKDSTAESNKERPEANLQAHDQDIDYEADKSSMASSNWQATEGPPVCNGCGRLFCMGKMACCRQGDGTPGWKRWAPKDDKWK